MAVRYLTSFFSVLNVFLSFFCAALLYRWYLGIQSKKDPGHVMTEVYKAMQVRYSTVQYIKEKVGGGRTSEMLNLPPGAYILLSSGLTNSRV